MNWKKLILIMALLTISVGSSKMSISSKKFYTKGITQEYHFHDKTPSEGIWEAMAYYGIPDSIQPIVYCQAKLESNLGKKTTKNNLFGLSSNGRVKTFKHWSESVKSYYNLIYIKYKEENHPDYYHFLMHIPPYDKPYAEDPHYIRKLKKLVSQLE